MRIDAVSYSRRQDVTPTQLQKPISSPNGVYFTNMPLFFSPTNLFSLEDTNLGLLHHLVLVRITKVLIADCASFNRENIKKIAKSTLSGH